MLESPSFKIITSESPRERRRDTSRAVVLIGFQRQGNLGLGYLAATLRSHGYPVEVLDFDTAHEQILELVKAREPILIGFSLIFQFYIRQFDALLRFLRAHGVASHFTMEDTSPV